jgi:hypothetical protein
MLNMTTFGAIRFAISITGFLVAGWFCLFRTNALVMRGRKSYERKVFGSFRIPGTVMKPWYPAYIRGMGIFLWLWVFGLFYFVVFLHAH